MLPIILWMINPVLGLISIFSVLAYSSLKDRPLKITAVILLLITTFIYQLSLPMPSDLAVLHKHYICISYAEDFKWFWLKKDFLSYGALNVLNGIFPESPISFYILSLVLIFLSLTWIYKKEAEDIRKGIDKVFFMGLFLGVLSFDETHHYLRQTTALFLFMNVLYLRSYTKYICLLLSILWHGSVVIFVPVLLFSKYFPKDRVRFVITATALTLIFFGLSQINIYQILSKSFSLNRHYTQFTFWDRFLAYFIDPIYSIYFEESFKLGNPLIWPYFVGTLIVVAYAIYTRRLGSIYLHFLLSLFWYLLMFQHHPLIYPRLEYIFGILFCWFWVVQIKYISTSHYKLIPVLVLVTCLLKIHFFNWPITLKYKDHYLLTYSPLTLLRDYSSWEINQVSELIDYYKTNKK